MFLKGKRYIYLGFISGVHGKKGKVIFRMRRRIPHEKLPPRIFIKKNGELEEFRIKLIKPYKRGFILKLNKVKGEEEAKVMVTSDVYILEDDLPRRSRVELGVIPEFIPEVRLKDEEIEELEEVGFITKPRGLQGAVAMVIPKEKEKFIKKGQKIYIENGKKFFETEIRSAKKLKEKEDNSYFSVKLLHVNDVNSAERLRKRKVYILLTDPLPSDNPA